MNVRTCHLVCLICNFLPSKCGPRAISRMNFVLSWTKNTFLCTIFGSRSRSEFCLSVFKLRRNANPDVKYKRDFLQKPIDWVVGDLEDVNLHLLRPSQGVMKPKFSCNFNTRHTPLPWMSGERFLASSEPFARVGSRLSATIFDVEVDQSFICTNNSDNRIQQTYN